MAISASSVLAYSDTDSDGEPNTTDANIFWGNLKTPEKSRTINDLPQTILRPRSTLQTQPYDSPSKPLTNYHPNAATQYEGGTENPQITPISTSIQTGGMDFRVPSSENSVAKNTDPISMQSPGCNETLHEDGRHTISETCSNPIEHNSPPPSLDMSCPETNLPVTTKEDCLDATPVQSRTEHPIVPYLPPLTNVTAQLPYPESQLNTDIPAPLTTPIKVVHINNDQSAPSAHHPIFLGTPGARDTSARKERRTKWKHYESQGRHPLLSLSPSSTSILNLVQSPVQGSHNKINITSSPLQKAQRVPAPALSHRSPMKPLRLGFFPPSVNLNDPNRIPARRIENPHSPLRSFIHSPARRIPVTAGDRTVVNQTMPKISEQASDVSVPSSSTHSELTPSQPSELQTAGHSGDTLGPTIAETSAKTPQKIIDIARGSSTVRPGLSRLPVPSSRSGRRPPPSLLSIQKRFDRAATTPSRIPSPLKRKVEDHNVPKSAEIQMRHLQSGSKRKRTEDASEDDANERPQKRMIYSALKEVDDSTMLTAKPSIQETAMEPSQDSDNPFAMIIDNSPLQSPVKEQTSNRKMTEHSGIPLMSTLSTSSNPRRTSRGRKRTPTPLNDESTESLPSRKSPATKPLSRPPSRTASRGGVNMEAWPDDPRQLQMVTSVNTQHNQGNLAELEHRVIRRSGNRPPSPSSKFRIDVDVKNREEREARAERRHRRDKDNDIVVFNGEDESVAPPSNLPTHETKRVQAPGDDEDYQTPIKDPIPSKLHPDRMTKTVKWCRSLIDAPPITSRPHNSGQTTVSKTPKSCFLRDPKTFSLNFLGNLPNADEPLTEVVKEHFVVSKFIYDDDIQESPRRSKKKALMKI